MGLKIINKVQALPCDPLYSYKKRSLTSINKIIIHHSATPTGSCEAFARYHVENNGWPGIGYHYVIDPQGNIYKTQNIGTISYHASGYNPSSIGICLIGDFNNSHPTQEAFDACVSLANELISTYKNICYVLSHKEAGATTSCPGKYFDMNRLRKEIKK